MSGSLRAHIIESQQQKNMRQWQCRCCAESIFNNEKRWKIPSFGNILTANNCFPFLVLALLLKLITANIHEGFAPLSKRYFCCNYHNFWCYMIMRSVRAPWTFNNHRTSCCRVCKIILSREHFRAWSIHSSCDLLAVNSCCSYKAVDVNGSLKLN